jgi:hypothetical protein
VVDELSKIRGVSNVGRSDGYNDETTFSIDVFPEVAKKDWGSSSAGGQSASEFVIPLRQLAGEIKRVLARVKMPVKVKGEAMSKMPVLDSKIVGPRKKSWKDEFGNRHSVYVQPLKVNFEVYITHR